MVFWVSDDRTHKIGRPIVTEGHQAKGIAQFQLNQVVHALRRPGLPAESLDEFSGRLRYPSGVKDLPRHFFSKRVVSNDRSHMRVFVSEVMCATYVLSLFITLVASPSGALADHAPAFKLLVQIVDILKNGSDDVGKVGTNLSAKRIRQE